MNWLELNLDGLIGPTHNYAGLSFGNVASRSNRLATSTPKAAALQGLAKMRAVAEMGVPQAVLPPQSRPNWRALHSLGFQGSNAQIIERAYDNAPTMLAACYSASNMWTANAATISPSPDTTDQRLHITPANLNSTLHRAIESPNTFEVLSFIFSDEKRFCVHPSLPSCAAMADEGAANHTRLTRQFGEKGLEVFVYGRSGLQEEESESPRKFPARQTLEASQAVARLHGLPDACLFVKQHPKAIDAGAFHNDVVSVGHEDLLLYHESAFAEKDEVIDSLRRTFEEATGGELCAIEISEKQLSLEQAIQVYLFNSQLISLPNGRIHMICPDNCQDNDNARDCLEEIVSGNNRIESYSCMNLRQSMMNGGGPACLRLRVVMNEEQLSAMHQGILFNVGLDQQLTEWVNRHYRESIAPEDLRDPQLAVEAETAMDKLEQILKLPSGLLSR